MKDNRIKKIILNPPARSLAQILNEPLNFKSPRFYMVGPYLQDGWKVSTKDITGSIIAIEKSITFDTWCYKVQSEDGKRTFWIYENDPTLRSPHLREGKIPKAPTALPPPIFIQE